MGRHKEEDEFYIEPPPVICRASGRTECLNCPLAICMHDREKEIKSSNPGPKKNEYWGKAIVAMKDGVEITYATKTDAARAMNAPEHIKGVCRKIRIALLTNGEAYGFKWRYADATD